MPTVKLAQQSLHRRTEADAKAPQFFAADLTTRHFSFEAYGLTEASCLDAMRRLLTAHAEATLRCEGVSIASWVETYMDDVTAQPRAMGEGYRDNECLTGGK